MAFVLAACGDDGGDDSEDAGDNEEATEEEESTDEEAAPSDACGFEDASFVATTPLEEGEVPVYDAPDGEEITTVPNIWASDDQGNQTPSVFLVNADDTEGDPMGTDWLAVDLPVPDGDGTGYIEADAVDVSCHGYRVTVDREAFSLTVTDEGEQVFETTVGLGRDDRATQEGTFFITDLTATTNPEGAYGPFAFALNAYADNEEVIAEFGENARAGIHGTNEPDALGTAVSSGCIRMENSAISALAGEGEEAVPLPLGTPVDVV